MARKAMVHTPDKPVDPTVRNPSESSTSLRKTDCGAFLTSGNEMERTDDNGVGYIKLDANMTRENSKSV